MKKTSKALVLSTGLLLGSSLPFVLPETVHVEAATVVKIPKTYYTTSVNLIMRTGAGNGYKAIMTIPKGKVVYSQERIGNWYRVYYTYPYQGKNITKNGWVWGSYLKQYDQFINISGMDLSTNKQAYLYPNPDTRRPALFKTALGAELRTTQKVINRYGELLYTVPYQGKTVYVKSWDVGQLVKLSKRTYLTNDNIPLRTWADWNYQSITTIPKDARLVSDARIGNWYRVTNTNGQTGWVWGSSLRAYNIFTTINETSLITNKTAYLWPTPDTARAASYKVTANVKLSSKQKVVNHYGDVLYTTLYNGSTVYVKAVDVNVVSTSTPQPPTTGLTETAISGKLFVTTSNLNMRQAADPGASLIVTIPNATFLTPTHVVSNGWYKVAFNGKTGYVSGDYIKEVVTGDPFHRNGYQFVDLRKPSKVTATQINNYIAANLNNRTSVLAGKGQVFINAGQKYGVNALYLAAHAIHESGFGTSNISLGKYNLFGYGSYDATPFVASYRFAQVDSGIEYIAQRIKSTYLNPSYGYYKGAYLGFSTKTVDKNTRVDANSEGMNFYYASDPKWGQKIAAHMQKILPYNKADYDNVAANTTVPVNPGIPAGLDTFPANIIAFANSTINLSSQKGGATVITIPAGKQFTLLEKHNDYWVKVNYNGIIYWTKPRFDVYKNYLSVKNLGRVTATSLNIRPTASTSLAPIGTFTLNQYVQLQVDATNNPITKINEGITWIFVKTADGKDGWVSTSYIAKELQ
ncbi:SH3 domain-containing protein [Bacillus sp. B-jedd]|uniref:SH3 domain-containing protein n=1 Tax=Bacillus sp. B-jedd TaxID=1476857 RepID=UPI00051555A7|nr:SH3 domain-containing protein [Bacillus sp. B-jedd]CEG29095.1 SH3 type 3 domain-containing protein [Bacillus sp. B-jedd]